MPDTTKNTPLTIDPSKLRAVVIAIVLSLSTIVGAISTVLSFVETRDLASLIIWLKSDTALQAIGSMIFIAGLAATGWRAFIRQAREIFYGKKLDDSVAVVERVPISQMIAPPAPPAEVEP
jgi:hypothetical protein